MTTPDTPKELAGVAEVGDLLLHVRERVQAAHGPVNREPLCFLSRAAARITSAERERDELREDTVSLRAGWNACEEALAEVQSRLTSNIATMITIAGERDELRASVLQALTTDGQRIEEIAELRAKVAELEVDTARLDFLDAMVAGPEPLRDGIDAVRAKQAQEGK